MTHDSANFISKRLLTINLKTISEKILETENLSETRKERIKQIKDTEDKNKTKDRLLVQVS